MTTLIIQNHSLVKKLILINDMAVYEFYKILREGYKYTEEHYNYGSEYNFKDEEGNLFRIEFRETPYFIDDIDGLLVVDHVGDCYEIIMKVNDSVDNRIKPKNPLRVLMTRNDIIKDFINSKEVAYLISKPLDGYRFKLWGNLFERLNITKINMIESDYYSKYEVDGEILDKTDEDGDYTEDFNLYFGEQRYLITMEV